MILETNPQVFIFVAVTFIIIMITLLIAMISRYKKCPSDKVMVIYGRVGSVNGVERTCKCIHGGAVFIWPFLQSYDFLDLTPITTSIDLEQAFSNEEQEVSINTRFSFGISTEKGIMENAAQRLLGMSLTRIEELAKDIIINQLRLYISQNSYADIRRDYSLEVLSKNIDDEIKKIGLRLININICKIKEI